MRRVVKASHYGRQMRLRALRSTARAPWFGAAVALLLVRSD